MARWNVLCLSGLFSVCAQASVNCPDDQAFELYELTRSPGVGEETYEYVIRQATRSMDGPALRSACFRLAHVLLTRGRTPEVWLSSIDYSDETIGALKEERPILQRCPPYSIPRDSWLPIVRAQPNLPSKVVRQEITGWVKLDALVDERGAVEGVRVVESSDALLEGAAVEAVQEFAYAPKVLGGQPVRSEHVAATIVIDYFDIARARGCDLGPVEPSGEEIARDLEQIGLMRESMPEYAREKVLKGIGSSTNPTSQ